MPSGTEAIFLWGAPGVGKTTIGRRLARTLGRPFIDTDAVVVQRTGIPIATIFAQQGEPAFRELEAQALALASQTPRAIVALGGGTVVAEANRRLIAQHGRSIHLRASIETLERRLQAARIRRPLLATIPIRTLLADRLPLYESADLAVDIDRRTLDEVVAEICRLL